MSCRPLNERELPDDYPVYGDYLYVADGKVIRSDVFGTVRDLRRDTGAKVITSCDIYGREALAKAGAL
ncbi:hypothetical protein HQ945_08570 [Phyllobacterium sp. BT25]|uniref:Uncharacterized protein n=1 Tax=Phyllobacterium pellucidum TaxID=2740464 RepID=A0A849VN45_9HYPH|nr:hypothetical protein [Phyllobacterium pellucidum]NTS31308.1 hypothetical protein [Phyllobacterium pellucidum]